MFAGSDFLLYAAVPVATWAALAMVRGFLARRALLDHPGARSSHAVPTPRGGGLAVVPVLAAAWVWVGVDRGWETSWWAVPFGALALAALSWWDDLRNLPAWPRLLAHLAIAGGVLAVAGPVRLGGDLLPAWLAVALAVPAWVWFINLYNFMDGIDGITGVETATLGFGAALVAAAADLSPGLEALGFTCGLAALAFLAWNWHPARLFLGDVGSVPLGFLLGFLLIRLAAEGQPVPAVILAAYYLADSGLTLLRRAMRGHNLLAGHRDHFYQLAVRGGWGHDRTALAIAAANALLVLLALIAIRFPLPALAAAALVTAATLYLLAKPFRAGNGRAP